MVQLATPFIAARGTLPPASEPSRARRGGPRRPTVRRRPATLSWLLFAYLAVGCLDVLAHRMMLF